MDTLLLDRATWDLALNSSGNIAVASTLYAAAQDISSECRTFYGEVYYDTTTGIPFFTAVFGQYRPFQMLREHLTNAAMRVPGVTEAVVYIVGVTDRGLSGQIQFKTDTGDTGTAAL